MGSDKAAHALLWSNRTETRYTVGSHSSLTVKTSQTVQKYKAGNEDANMISEPSSPQSSTRSRSPSPDDILERAAADVKEYERENLNTFEASIKAKHNLIAQEKDGTARSHRRVPEHASIQGQLNERCHQE